MTDTTNEMNPLEMISSGQSQAELEQLLVQHQQHLRELPDDANPIDRARVELDVAETLLGLNRMEEAWNQALAAFDLFLKAEAWQDAVEACDVLYRTEMPDSIAALGNGVWLAVTYPIKAQTTVNMLHHIVDETPPNADGAAVAAAVAHYIADMRTEGKEHDSLPFLTAQLLAKVAKRHRNIEGEEMINLWMETLQLNDPAELFPRLAKMLDVIVGDKWWYDRDELRARLPVN